MDITEITQQLQKYGLTKYESSCYITLTRLGHSEPRKIAEVGGIPYPNAYESLKRLEDRGWVERVRRRPATYRARRPVIVRDEMITEIMELFENLDKLYNATPSEEAELVFTIREKRKVISKISELLKNVTENVIAVGPLQSFVDTRLKEMLIDLARRGINVRVISSGEVVATMPKEVDCRIGNPVAFDLLIDDRIALIALPDLSACGWADSAAIAGHFLQFLELMWSNASIPSK